MKIAVLGGGNGAHAAAADLTFRGHEVHMYEFPEFKKNVEPAMEEGGINLVGVAGHGFAKISTITTNIKEAVQGVDVILPVMPRFGDQRVLEVITPHLEDGQIIVFAPGVAGSALVAHKVLKEEKGTKKDLKIAQCSTLPYACRVIEPGLVRIKLVAKWFGFSAMPSEDTKETLEVFKKLYPAADKMTNVLEVDIINGNLISHPAPMICNAGRIEYVYTQLTGNRYRTPVNYYHYREGITPSVARIMELHDKEKMAIQKALGFKVISDNERMYMTGYADKIYDTIYEGKHSWVYCGPYASVGPTSLKSRMLTEDIPYGVVPVSTLGGLVGVPTPVMKAIVTIASILNDTDHWKEGRTMKKLGLAQMSIPEIFEYLKTGEHQ